ncbi:MAG: F0F1 ATP synthase subunit A [Desulfobacterales bacterium]
MGDLGRIHQLIIPVMGHNITLNLEAIIMTWIVIGLLILFGFYSSKNRSVRPGTVQLLGEMIVSQIYSLTEDALDKEKGKKYAPLITALFMFLLLCNWIGMFPHMHEPTKDLNTPLSLGIMGFFIAHYAGIKSKGIKAYLKEYCEPIFLMAPLNIIGELSKIVSISFRLFGNIMGGSIIILVVSYLVFNLVLPPLLIAFFGLFVGAIQAFVFTMLTVVYISVQVK